MELSILVSNSVPKDPANPTGTRGQGSVSLPALLFFTFIIQQISLFPLQAPGTPCPGKNRLSFLLLKTGFPGVDRLSWEGDGFSEAAPGQAEGEAVSPLTQRVPSDDAVFHLPTRARVPVVGQESPDTRAGLALGDIEGTLVGPGKGGTVVVDVVEVHQHLRSG